MAAQSVSFGFPREAVHENGGSFAVPKPGRSAFEKQQIAQLRQRIWNDLERLGRMISTCGALFERDDTPLSDFQAHYAELDYTKQAVERSYAMIDFSRLMPREKEEIQQLFSKHCTNSVPLKLMFQCLAGQITQLKQAKNLG
jgi:hypothetical protein